jgi:tripartite-type tricarboxylate transporter receptor subunit TctC
MKEKPRSNLLNALIIICSTMLLTVAAVNNLFAQTSDRNYPTRPITCVFPTDAGSMLDTMSRPLLQLVEKILGQPIMVVNKPGGGLIVGLREVLNAKPDGYTIGFGVGNLSYAKLLGIVPFDHKDFDVISIPYYGVPIITVPKSSKFTSVEDIINFSKSNPGKLKVATSTKGGAWWVATRMFAREAKIEINEISQAGGGGAIILQVAGGHVDVAIHGMPEAKSQIEAGNLKVLACFGDRRMPGLAEIATLRELGMNIDFLATNTAVMPKNVDPKIREKIVAAFAEALKNEQYQNFAVKNDATVMGVTGKEAITVLDKQIEDIRPILQEAGLIK